MKTRVYSFILTSFLFAGCDAVSKTPVVNPVSSTSVSSEKASAPVASSVEVKVEDSGVVSPDSAVVVPSVVVDSGAVDALHVVPKVDHDAKVDVKK